MPDLASLTDAYRYAQPNNTLPVDDPPLPVEQPYVATPRIDVYKDAAPARPESIPDVGSGVLEQPFSAGNATVNRIVDRLTTNGEERYQTWPEKVIREALSAAHDVNEQGTLPAGLRREDFTDIPAPSMPTNDSTWLGQKLGIAPVAASPADNVIGQAQAISALAGSGGIAGVGEDAGAALGSTPFLRPALKYGDKIYKAPVNGQHLDALPAHLAQDFQSKAMTGDDISHYNFGFMNHKGQFLDREKALDYAVKEGLVDPSAGQYGALTSTLLADSSKPGTAIEAMAKARQPYLEAAIRDEGKFYRGDTHLDALSKAPAEDRSRLSLDGNNRGWMNDKGRFLNRERAQKYAVENDLIKDGAPSWVPTSREAIAEWIKPRATLLADSSKPGTAIEAMAKTGSPFYSALEHNVNQISQSKMTGDQWLGTLANKPGVKPEELDWTGVKSFLEERGKQPVTKAELQEHLTNNKVELKEVNKGAQKTIEQRTKEYEDKGFNKEEAETRAYADHDGSNFTSTKYHSYQLPGGENYREMLMTLPSKSMAADKEAMESVAKLIHNKPYGELTKAQQENVERMAMVGNPASKAMDYKSSHWDEPNILAHVRMNDRVIDGKKSLHLEEVQSDWHQQGRDRGYKNPEKAAKAKAIMEEMAAIEKEKGGLSGGMKDARWKELDKELDKHPNDDLGVPDAPFKKTWHELALKRMIREAAEKGYDRLSWTPGEAQAARYDLSKSIDKLQYHSDKQRLVAFDKDHNLKMDESIPPEKVADYVGKEAAKKLLDAEPNHLGIHSLEGANLKIGGEGMKGFYDQIIPKSLEKISGEKVKHGSVPSTEGTYKYNGPTKTIDELIKLHDDQSLSRREHIVLGDVLADMGSGTSFENAMGKHGNKYLAAQLGGELKPVLKQQPIHYIDIPQSLKDKAMHKGFPLFSNGYMYTPVSGDPFKNEKKK